MKTLISKVKSNAAGLSKIAIAFRAGSAYENVGERGFSHLLEHMVCDAVNDMDSEFTERGLEFNAVTMPNSVVFVIAGLTDQVNAVRDRFVESITDCLLTQESLDKQLGIVLKEYDEKLSKQNYFYRNIAIRKYGYYFPLGARPDLENITLEKLTAFYEATFDVAYIYEVGEAAGPYYDVSLAEENVVSTIDNSFEDKLEASFPNTIIYDYVAFEDKGISVCELSVLCEMLSNGFHSPLMQEIREKRGLAYSPSSDFLIMRDNLLFLFMITTTNDKVEEVRYIIEDIRKNTPKYFTEHRFNQIRQSKYLELKKDSIKNFNFMPSLSDAYDPIRMKLTEEFLDNITWNRMVEVIELWAASPLKKASYGKEMLIEL